MAYLSYDTIKEVLKRCEGMTRQQAMDYYGLQERLDPHYMPSPEEWRRQMEQHGYVPPPGCGVLPGQPIPEGYQANASNQGLTGHGIAAHQFRPLGRQQVYEATPEVKAILQGKTATQVIVDDPHKPPSSTLPQKAKQEHMWDMLVLAARSSRYGE
jgi:hypothetical protein